MSPQCRSKELLLNIPSELYDKKVKLKKKQKKNPPIQLYLAYLASSYFRLGINQAEEMLLFLTIYIYILFKHKGDAIW